MSQVNHIKRLSEALNGMVTAVEAVDGRYTLHGAGTILDALEEAKQVQREHTDWLLSHCS